MMNFEVSQLKNILEEGNVEKIKAFLQEHDLDIRDGRVFYKNEKELKNEIDFYDRTQHIKKITLNSLFGTLLQPNSRFFDERLGKSITLTGRVVVKNMCAYINEVVTGNNRYDGKAINYSDTDSIFSNTTIITNNGPLTIKEVWKDAQGHQELNTKEYGYGLPYKVLSYDGEDSYFGEVQYVYRHKVSKERYKITSESGQEIICTGDHSIMVERNEELVECKPSEVQLNDFLIINIPDEKVF